MRADPADETAPSSIAGDPFDKIAQVIPPAFSRARTPGTSG